MKSFFTGSVIKLVIFAALIATVINDGGSIIATQYLLGERVAKVGEAATSMYKTSGSSARARQEAEIVASEIGLVVTDVQITNYNKSLTVSVEAPNTRTWIAHRVTALRPYLSPRTTYTKNIR